MRPSISVTLEPRLEQAVPWGRDLYTFVTSAAGHMMRTLQKPRKNRPSKRQVNHRRFLHNMIQRKFADIEAANHRLASALYFKEEDKNMSSLPSKKPETLDQSGSPSQAGYLQDPDKHSVHTGADSVSTSRSDVSVGSHEAEISEKKQPDSGHLWKRHLKSQPAACTAARSKQSKERQKEERRNHKLVEFPSMSSPIDHHHGAELFHPAYYDDESAQKSANNLSEDSQTAQQDFLHFGQNLDVSPPFSPELSPLSLDSCDFSIQMFTDCTQAQRNIADISKSQWTDIVDLLSVDNKDLGGCMDVEAYFESICACQGDAGQEVSAGDVGFVDQSDSFCSHRSEVKDLHCETDYEYTYEYGYSCHGDQGQNEDIAETQFNDFNPSRGIDFIHNQLPTSITDCYNISEPQTYQQPQEESPCMLMKSRNFAPFEGVAQSFSAPLHNPEERLIPTPPHEDDWLFTDILKDRKSPDS